MTGVQRNVIDWLSRPVEESPHDHQSGALMGAGARLDAARAQWAVRQAPVFTDSYGTPKPERFIPQAQDRFDAYSAPTRRLLDAGECR